jgi:hypothetical protein
MRSGVALGPVPSRPTIPGLAPPPSWEGRFTARALDLKRANAAPDSYVEVPAFGAGSSGRGGSQPNLEQARRSSFRLVMPDALLLVVAYAYLVACVPADRTPAALVFGG